MSVLAQVYMLKDLSRLSGHSIHTLKFYLKIGLIHETGRSPETRFRYFDDSTLARLAQIRSYRKQEKSLAEIAHLLAEQGTSHLSPGASIKA
ncbi:MAG: MerR family transcriptional regulator [Candidatus Omnitrophica bacterium]|nr:MerR family transcriptional regulator [Candidatus Omnitrophota bacterium]